MDPKATLRRALECLRDHDPDGVRDALADYRDWRRAGGYEPNYQGFRGDNLAAFIADAVTMLAPAGMEG